MRRSCSSSFRAGTRSVRRPLAASCRFRVINFIPCTSQLQSRPIASYRIDRFVLARPSRENWSSVHAFFSPYSRRTGHAHTSDREAIGSELWAAFAWEGETGAAHRFSRPCRLAQSRSRARWQLSCSGHYYIHAACVTVPIEKQGLPLLACDCAWLGQGWISQFCPFHVRFKVSA